jgi:tetratricopeptide (TPR) repeat protein
MAKSRRQTAQAAASKSAAPKKRPKATSAAKRPGATRKRAARPTPSLGAGYAKAIALYQRGLKALQRRQYETAATAFGQLLEQHPDERELHERARLYLAVCKRETGPRAKPPRGVEDRILAATLALNRRDVDEALALLRTAGVAESNQDHVQYLLALAHAQRADPEAAGRHLSKAIALNPKNRVTAKHEADFDAIRESRPFRDALETT